MESRESLQAALQEIQAWENDQKDLFIWEKIGRIPFMILDKMTPAFLHNKIKQIVEELANYVDHGGKYLTKPATSFQTASQAIEKPIVGFMDIQTLSLAEMDTIADHFVSSRKKAATVQGASTGLGGLFTLAIDIPFIVGLTLKTLQETAISYGYDPQDPAERIFIVQCMQFASSDIVGKRALLDQWNEASSRNATSQVQGWREVFTMYADNYGWKKLFQMIPVAGMVFGAFINRQSINDVGEVGKMMYKKRRILERLSTEN